MAGIKEILEVERARESVADWQLINLFQEGSFYRAYEVSAWLCVRFVHGFKASNRMYKGIEDSVALIGFPPTSLSKFTPDGAETQNVSENEIDLILPSTSIPDEYDTALMQLEYSDWKSSLPVQSLSQCPVI